MTEKRIREILASVASGKVGAEAAFEALKDLPFEDLGFAKLDSHRTMRRGVPEVVFGENKTVEQMAAIGARVVKSGNQPDHHAAGGRQGASAEAQDPAPQIST